MKFASKVALKTQNNAITSRKTCQKTVLTAAFEKIHNAQNIQKHTKTV